MISVFSRLHSRYICLQLSACLVIAVLTATLASAIQLLPGSLPAGTAKLKFQRTVQMIPLFAPYGAAKIISIKTASMLLMEYSFAFLEKGGST
jgi:hypothetical protein